MIVPKEKESRHSDSNRGPTVYKTVALPLSYAGAGGRRISSARKEGIANFRRWCKW